MKFNILHWFTLHQKTYFNTICLCERRILGAFDESEVWAMFYLVHCSAVFNNVVYCIMLWWHDKMASWSKIYANMWYGTVNYKICSKTPAVYTSYEIIAWKAYTRKCYQIKRLHKGIEWYILCIIPKLDIGFSCLLKVTLIMWCNSLCRGCVMDWISFLGS